MQGLLAGCAKGIIAFCIVIFSGNIATAAEGVPRRILIIGIDAIPFDVVKQVSSESLGDRAVFRDMNPPIAVINAFPANSDLAWSALLEPFGVRKAMGYEARYYDSNNNMVVGGDNLIEPYAPWKRFFDWRLRGVITGAVAYGWSKQYSLKEFRQGLTKFRQSTKSVYSIYIISTDAVGHIYGPEAQAVILRRIARDLAEFKHNHPDQRFYTILLSDHGMAGSGKPLSNTWTGVRQAIRTAGYRFREKLDGPTDVVMIPYGLLSSFVIYSKELQADKIAKAVVRAPGIDLCVTSHNKIQIVHNAKGDAQIYTRQLGQQLQWRYQIRTADPLAYQSVIQRLQRISTNKKAVWFSDQSWFQATRHHQYPDALYRLGRAFNLVINPASVVCSVKPGFMFGALTTEYIARATIGRLRWTHGALNRSSSLGFVMHDFPNWPRPDVVRFTEALAPLKQRWDGKNLTK